MLAVVACIGAGPVSFLTKRFGTVERFGLAPVLGLCLGTSVFTTLVYFFPASGTWWLVPVIGLVSLAVALARSRASISLRPARGTVLGCLSLLLAIAAVTAPTLSVMRAQHTIGPAMFDVGDSMAYIGETDAEANLSMHGALLHSAVYDDLEDRLFADYVHGDQNLDGSPLSANVNEMLGLGSTATWMAFLLAFLSAGALGAVAFVRFALRAYSASPAAIGVAGTLAGVMFGGAFFLQLYFAGSQAALLGLSILLPLAAVTADAVAEPRWSTLVVLGIASSGLMSMYPLYVASASVLALGVLVTLAISARRRGDLRTALRYAVPRIVFALAVSVCLNLVSFTRDLRYWSALLRGGFVSNGFPVFDMRIDGLPAWLLQTRNIFQLTTWAHSSPVELLAGLVLPLVLVLVMIFAVRRVPRLAWLIVVVAASAALGEWEYVKSSCSYCTDRSLVPIAPMLVALACVGLGVLWASRSRLAIVLASLVACGWLVIAFGAQRDLRQRIPATGTFLDASAWQAMQALPPHASVLVEGFDSNNTSPFEQAYAYEMAESASHGRATITADVDNFSALVYLGAPLPLTAGQFDPNYEYVLSKFSGVQTDRQVVSRVGAAVLAKRTRSLDAILDSGVFSPVAEVDAAGAALVSNTTPVRVVVAGYSSRPAYVRAQMTASVPATVERRRGLRSIVNGQAISVCLRATGRSPRRVAQFQVSFTPTPVASGPTEGPYAAGALPGGVALTSLRVSTRPCTQVSSG